MEDQQPERAVLWYPVLDRAPLPIVAVEGARHIVAYANSAFCRLMSRGLEELIGHAFSELAPDHDGCLKLLDRVYRSGEPETCKEDSESESHSIFSSSSAWPLLGREAQVVGVVLHVPETTEIRDQLVVMNAALARGFIRQHEQTAAAETLNARLQEEIGARTKAENEMALERDKAIAAVRARDDFLAALSHELRTPLNPVLLVAEEEAADEANPAGIREAFTTIAKNVKLEARLIDDLLDLTRIAHGKLKLHLEPVDLHAVLRDACETTRADFADKNITLLLNLAPSDPWVEGDPVRLQQVFWNVLRNAAKFTPPAGTVTVETVFLATGIFRVSVTDTGIGMTAEEVARVFEMFTQGDHVVDRGQHRFGGLGLGLAISRVLTELHSGTLRAESAGCGLGSRFYIELPARPTGDAGQPIPSPTRTATQPTLACLRRILLVEDHEQSRVAIAHLLVRRHYDVVQVGTVAEAQMAAESGQFDLVISDVGLPDGSGHDLMTELHTAYGLVGIAMTGYGKEEDVARSLRAGFATHLTKPVSIQALQDALDFVAAGKGAGGPVRPTQGPEDLR